MKRTFLISVCILLFLQVGCWDKQEANEITIVTGLAIDKGEQAKYKLSVEVMNPPAMDPQQGGAQHTASVLFALEGESIGELATKMNIGFTRDLMFGHMHLVVISKEVAEDGLLEFLDFLERHREIRNDFDLIISKGRAEDVLKITYHIQRVSSLKLSAQLETMVDEWGGSPDIQFRDIIQALIFEGREPVATLVSIQGAPEAGESERNKEQVEPGAIVVLDGIAVFKGFKYKGELSVRDTRNYLWITDELRQTSFSVGCGNNGGVTTFRVNKSKTRVNAEYKEDTPSFFIEIEFDTMIYSTQCPDDLSQVNIYREYEKRIAKVIEEEILSTIKTMQEKYQSDIFGLGEHMERQQYPQFQKVKDRWNEEFAKAQINVHVIPKIRRSGLTTESFLYQIKQD